MAEDPFYLKCCATGERGTRGDPVEWHHNLIFAGRQVQEAFAILPIKRSLHAQAHLPEVKDQLDWIMLSRASQEQLDRYSKAIDLRARLATLEDYFGEYSPQETPAW